MNLGLAEVAGLLAAALAGALLALGFLMLLRQWTQCLVLGRDSERSSSPLRLAFAMTIRLGLVIGGFAMLLIIGDARTGLAALGGFLAARAFLLRRLTAPAAHSERAFKEQKP